MEIKGSSPYRRYRRTRRLFQRHEKCGDGLVRTKFRTLKDCFNGRRFSIVSPLLPNSVEESESSFQVLAGRTFGTTWTGHVSKGPARGFQYYFCVFLISQRLKRNIPYCMGSGRPVSSPNCLSSSSSCCTFQFVLSRGSKSSFRVLPYSWRQVRPTMSPNCQVKSPMLSSNNTSVAIHDGE